MADTIKYVSSENLKYYDGKIKAYLEGKDAAVQAALEGQLEVVAGALDKEIERAKKAEGENATAAQNAQTAADNLAEYVGTFTSDSAETVVAYVDEKVAGAVSDTTELAGRVKAIEDDYLVEADKTELSNAINLKADKTQVATDIATAVKAEEDARKEAVAGVQGAVDGLAQTVAGNKSAIEGTVSTLEAKVDANEEDIEDKMTKLTARVAANETAVGTTLPNAINAEKARAEGVEESLQTQINTIMNNPDTEGVINSINEFTQYIEDHGEIADGFRTDIDKNKEDIAALAQTHAKDKSDLELAINAKVAQTEYDAKVEALEGADASQIERIAALEGKVGTGDTTVDSKIATAKQEAIDAAAEDAANKCAVALGESQKYADGLNSAMTTRVDEIVETVGTKASQADLNAAVERIAAEEGKSANFETRIAANEAFIAGIEFMTEADINGLFA